MKDRYADEHPVEYANLDAMLETQQHRCCNGNSTTSSYLHHDENMVCLETSGIYMYRFDDDNKQDR